MEKKQLFCRTEDEVMACDKCNDTGWYKYDDNHSTRCHVCCKHDKGSWLLKEHYGESNGKWCCMAGCGHTEEKEF